MTSPTPAQETYIILGAGVIGLTTALQLHTTHPTATIKVIAKHVPGDSSVEYCSPWAGANWLSFATDGGRQEGWDRVTFEKFGALCRQGQAAVHHGDGVGGQASNERCGIWEMDIKACFDNSVEESGVLSVGEGGIWYRDLVREFRMLEQVEVPEGAKWGFECGTFVVDTGRYLGWLQQELLTVNIPIHRQSYDSLAATLAANPDTTALFNCTGLGSLALTDVMDTALYPIRGQVLLVENAHNIEKMYFRSPMRVARDTTYVFPRGRNGGVVLGGTREDGVWSDAWNEEAEAGILKRCVALCPELGRAEDLKVIKRGVGLRPGRTGGARIEKEMFGDKVVIHCYGSSGAGYQASWGMAKEAVELLGDVVPSAHLSFHKL